MFVVAERSTLVPAYTLLVVPPRETVQAQLPARIVSPERDEIPNLVTLPELPPAVTITLPPVFESVPPAAPHAVPAIVGIGRSLECRLGNLANLHDEQKARCAERLNSEPPPPFALTAEERRMWELWALEIETRRALPPCNADTANGGMFCTFSRLNGAAALARVMDEMR
jgi:hypothetical protein